MQTISDTRHAPQIRQVVDAVVGDDALGPFTLLPGTWSNEPGLPGRGWNMIALPFGPPPGATFRPPYRLLMNQYDENLVFDLVDKAVPNRGIAPSADGPRPADQLLVTLDYEQGIKQLAAEDFPATTLGGPPGAAIHHEPGLFLHLTDPLDEDSTEIARLATIPHGDSVLAMGTVRVIDGRRRSRRSTRCRSASSRTSRPTGTSSPTSTSGTTGSAACSTRWTPRRC